MLSSGGEHLRQGEKAVTILGVDVGLFCGDAGNE